MWLLLRRRSRRSVDHPAAQITKHSAVVLRVFLTQNARHGPVLSGFQLSHRVVEARHRLSTLLQILVEISLNVLGTINILAMHIENKISRHETGMVHVLIDQPFGKRQASIFGLKVMIEHNQGWAAIVENCRLGGINGSGDNPI